ncbi:hypothetical protein [Flavobacterium silvaticum]|uniref:PH domain-containing protein n=1 Tax=Flavobacterium silvaticum TaxID=1852020 RepID=A0A972FLL8_9FLAO|nr:hypothetical protein [Flavobacterium silvaticum]NMH27490.1 hypothetical protein [Flavobacterium silvaticum]
MSKTYTASRLSEGNKVFPASITVEQGGLTIKIPGLWKNEETFLGYKDIAGVSIDTPLIGYSTIEFNVQGNVISAHGFKKSEVREIKEAIHKGKNS